MKKMLALSAVFCCAALAQMGALYGDCGCEGKGCNCSKPPKKTLPVEDKGCGCNKPKPPKKVTE